MAGIEQVRSNWLEQSFAVKILAFLDTSHEHGFTLSPLFVLSLIGSYLPGHQA